MSSFERIKNVLFGIIMLVFALLLIIAPKESLPLIILVLSISLYIRGFRQLYFYLSMARHMVGGKSVLLRSIVILDAAILMTSAIAMSQQIIMFYMIFLYAFSGVIDVLRAFEAKNHGAPRWKFKFGTGIVEVLFAIALLIMGMFVGNPILIVYGYAISLIYSAAVKIIGAFKRTAVVYVTT